MDLAARMNRQPVRGLLAVNAGSTSLKASLLALEAGRWQTRGEWDALTPALAAARQQGVDAAVHRVVHGGGRTRATVVDDAVRAELAGLTELAPLHQPPALHALDAARTALPQVVQVACFDTAFHTSIPAAAATYALPARLRAQVRVYGFHGLSHAWSAGQAHRWVPGAARVLIAHLGGGQSLCAVRDGRSIATTMGFTPLDGLVMATRSGSVDPGALLWLARHTTEDLDAVLEQESGLLGLCGTADMRQVLTRAAGGDSAASLALDVYLHRLVTSCGAMVAALDGLDVLVVTGGVGEHAAEIRRRLGERLAWLGVRVQPRGPDEQTEATGQADVTGEGATVHTLVIPAREDLQMASEAETVLNR